MPFLGLTSRNNELNHHNSRVHYSSLTKIGLRKNSTSLFQSPKLYKHSQDKNEYLVKSKKKNKHKLAIYKTPDKVTNFSNYENFKYYVKSPNSSRTSPNMSRYGKSLIF